MNRTTGARSKRQHIAGKADSVQLIGVDGGRVVYEVGSGQYQFHVANRSTQGRQ